MVDAQRLLKDLRLGSSARRSRVVVGSAALGSNASHVLSVAYLFQEERARRLMFSEFFCHCLGGVADSSQVSATVMRRVLLLL